jgi:hypothetical protein
MNTSYGHHLLPRADTVWKLALKHLLTDFFVTFLPIFLEWVIVYFSKIGRRYGPQTP